MGDNRRHNLNKIDPKVKRRLMTRSNAANNRIMATPSLKRRRTKMEWIRRLADSVMSTSGEATAKLGLPSARKRERERERQTQTDI